MPEPASAARSREASTRTPAAATAEPRRPVIVLELAGKRLFRTSRGELIELPEGMSGEEAARLEAEALAAERRLGRGPAPRSVPQVRAPAVKPPKKQPARRRARRSRLGAAQAAAKAVAAAAAGLVAVAGTSRVAQYLAARALPVLQRGSAALARLRQNEQTHDDAGQKRDQAEAAVEIPPSDNQSRSNADQVHEVGGRTAPAVDAAKGKGRLDAALKDNLPRTLEDVDNFKRDRRAQHVGAEVLESVQGDKNAVMGTFGDLRHTPAPAPPEHESVGLPPEEKAPGTPPLQLGRGAVAPLLPEHTDFSGYAHEADARLKEEGITQEQLDMVDAGELAEANREKKGLESKARSEPQAIQALARTEAERVDKELAQQEQAGRGALRAKRRFALGATGQRQRRAKGELERKRDEVAARVNAIYAAAQASVKKKLDGLEAESMRRFDDGNAAATKAFEDNVKREFDAYKADRYSGWFGWARRAKDWLLGMDELPRVKEIFETNRRAFVSTVNRLVETITADNRRVIQTCKDELADAQTRIDKFVAELEPALQGIGRKAAGEMKERLADLDQTIERREEDLRGKLRERQSSAIRAIDDRITKMKEAMSGALAKVGRLLLRAAKKFFSWALGKFGLSLSTIEPVIDKGIAVLKAVFSGPIRFVKNLVGAASQGFTNFAKHFLVHLKNAVFEWLTGSLEGVQLPAVWNLRGILSIVFQLVGISYANIRAHLVRLVPEPVVNALETGFGLVKTLVTEGPMAAWEQLKEIGGALQDAFVAAVKDWIKWKIVEEAVKTILALFVPGAGLLRAIVAIYDTIVFFIRKAKEIARMVGHFLGSIADIAAGNLGAAAAALEEGLARGLNLVIGFLASFLRLTGISSKIREVIRAMRGRVDAVIERVAKWVVGLAQKAGRIAVGTALGGKPLAPPEERLESGLQEAVAAVNRLSGHRVGLSLIQPLLGAIRLRHGMQSLQAVAVAGQWVIEGVVNPKRSKPTSKRAAEIGTAADNPFVIEWPKRPLAKYAPVWLVPQDVANGREYTQAKLRTLPRAEEFKPNAPRPLFGGPTIGVTAAYRTTLNKTFGPAPHARPASLSQLEAFKALFKRHGYDRERGDSEGTTDADHVSELQMTGPSGDTFANLWPLNYSENRSSGSSLSQTKVTLADNSVKAIRDLSAASWHFRIGRFRS